MAQNITTTAFAITSLSKGKGGSERTAMVREYIVEAIGRGVDIPLGEIDAELYPGEEVYLEAWSSQGAKIGKFPILAVEVDGTQAIITSTRGRQIICHRLPSGNDANSCRALHRGVVDLGYGPRYLVA